MFKKNTKHQGQLRLSTRPMGVADESFVIGLYGDDEVMKLVGGALSKRAAKAVFASMLKAEKSAKDSYQIVSDSTSQADVGFLSMQLHHEPQPYLEVGIILAVDYQGLGIARWIQHRAFEYGKKQLGIKRFSVYCHPEHEGVNRCYERMGFKLVDNVSNKKQHQNKHHWRLILE